MSSSVFVLDKKFLVARGLHTYSSPRKVVQAQLESAGAVASRFLSRLINCSRFYFFPVIIQRFSLLPVDSLFWAARLIGFGNWRSKWGQNCAGVLGANREWGKK